MSHLFINEIFGPTWQGEGPSVGTPCHFIRLVGCSHHCVWCDTAYTWRFDDTHPHKDGIVYDKSKESHKVSILDLVDQFSQYSVPIIVISGGEPMLQAEGLVEFVKGVIRKKHFHFEIETTGTIWNDKLPRLPHVFFNVSPKLENSGNPKELRYKPSILKQYARHYQSRFKFVVSTLADLYEVDDIIKDCNIDRGNVWIMAEGRTQEEQDSTLSADLLDEILARRFRISPRLHVQLWGNKRGV